MMTKCVSTISRGNSKLYLSKRLKILGGGGGTFAAPCSCQYNSERAFLHKMFTRLQVVSAPDAVTSNCAPLRGN